jgi:serine/threonine-protein kinase
MKSGNIVGGKYRLTQRLGAGAMGAVWEAINERTGGKVALKLVLNPSDEIRQRLLTEARACGSLAHRNVVAVHDVGETESGEPFLVMQLLSGETLAELLRRKRRIEPALAARIGRDIASALAAAHGARIIHRDLKPANIFLHREAGADEDGFVVKVLDFGVAKSLASHDGPATLTGTVLGSPAYMSPEQVRMVKDLDHRTDIWSLGIVLFEMLVGVRPFIGSVDALIRQILTAPIPPVSSRVRGIDPELDALVALCLERDRGKRIHAAAELSRMLDAHLEARPASRVQVYPTPPPLLAEPATLCARQDAAADDEDLALTIPLRRARPLGMPSRSASDSERPEPAPGATQILSITEPLGSPLPAWRLEMQQVLAASRQATATLGGAQADELPHGGTMAMAPFLVDERDAVTGATTMAPLVQMANIEGTPRSEPPLPSEPGRRRGNAIIVAAVGACVAVVVFGAVYLGILSARMPSRGAMQPAVAEHAMARVLGSMPSSAPPPSVPVVPAEPPPSKNEIPLVTPAPSTSPTLRSQPFKKAAPPMQRVLPPCGFLIKPGCKPRNPYD